MKNLKFKKHELITYINSKNDLKEKFKSIFHRDVIDYFDEYKYIKEIHIFVASDMKITQEEVDVFLNNNKKKI